MSVAVKILTPIGEKLTIDVDQITMSGSEGEFGVLKDHTPLMAALKEGMATIRQGIQNRYFALGPGYAEIFHNQITIFTNHAEESVEIDTERAQKSLQKSKKRQESATTEAEKQNSQAAMERANNRLETAKKK